MSLWGRFLGNRRNRACAEGVTLLEQGRFSEAVDLLRQASLDSSDHPTGSLASFHFRQALVSQGRLHLRTGESTAAITCFAEAAKLWDQYPDLHCLLGSAQGISGDWDAALTGARTALRRNPDYAEARLLEALALKRLDRRREAADALNTLVESGRRVEHWLIDGLKSREQYGTDDLPEELEALLISSLSGQSEKEEVAAAVAQCRAGNWSEGLERFAGLVRKRPRYPDYRTRHSAALFHLGRNEEALAEVEAALALNDTYRTAINLKGLILADEGRLKEARDFLVEVDGAETTGKSAGAHEELFGAYLRAVLALLTGNVRQAMELLGSWGDLAKSFARSELLLAAADDLLGQNLSSGRRLAALAEEWTAEPIYFHLLACHHLAAGNFEEATAAIGRWPVGAADPDHRPLYIEALISLGQGRVPDLPEDTGTSSSPDEIFYLGIRLQAWQWLEARCEMRRGHPAEARQMCEDLVTAGFDTEPVVKLMTEAALGSDDPVPPGWRPPAVLPDSCLPAMAYLGHERGFRDEPTALVEKYLAVHPEQIRALWLSPSFWLDPVRSWIA
jgi:tetratricopeptide (TPR) repeat protein